MTRVFSVRLVVLCHIILHWVAHWNGLWGQTHYFLHTANNTGFVFSATKTLEAAASLDVLNMTLWQLYTVPRWLSLQSPGLLLMEMVKASFFTTLNHFPPQKLICCVTSPIFACPRRDLGLFGISSVCIDVMQMACWRCFIYVYVLSGCLFIKITYKSTYSIGVTIIFCASITCNMPQ